MCCSQSATGKTIGFAEYMTWEIRKSYCVHTNFPTLKIFSCAARQEASKRSYTMIFDTTTKCRSPYIEKLTLLLTSTGLQNGAGASAWKKYTFRLFRTRSADVRRSLGVARNKSKRFKIVYDMTTHVYWNHCALTQYQYAAGAQFRNMFLQFAH